LDYSGILENLFTVALKQIKYGRNIYLSGVVNFFYEPLTRILISNFIGVREVGFFDIASKIVGQIMALFSKILYPFFPLFSKLSDSKKLAFIVTDVQQKLIFVVMPCVTIIFFVVAPGVNLWLNQHFKEISFSIIALTSVNLLFSVPVIPMYHFVGAKNRTEVMIYTQIATVVSSGIVFFLTVRSYGYTAAVLGNMAGIIGGFIVLTYYQKMLLNTNTFSSFNQLLKWAAILASSLTIAFVASLILPSDILKVAVIPIVVSITALLLFRYFKVFSENDVNIYFGEHQLVRVVVSKLFIR
jgi:O-antigen/teichoic acid export membrane protein